MSDIQPNVKVGGFLPPLAQYLKPFSKQTEAVTLLLVAGLSWICTQVAEYPNPTKITSLPLTK
jgi:hypothetical protein